MKPEEEQKKRNSVMFSKIHMKNDQMDAFMCAACVYSALSDVRQSHSHRRTLYRIAGSVTWTDRIAAWFDSACSRWFAISFPFRRREIAWWSDQRPPEREKTKQNKHTQFVSTSELNSSWIKSSKSKEKRPKINKTIQFWKKMEEKSKLCDKKKK